MSVDSPTPALRIVLYGTRPNVKTKFVGRNNVEITLDSEKKIREKIIQPIHNGDWGFIDRTKKQGVARRT